MTIAPGRSITRAAGWRASTAARSPTAAMSPPWIATAPSGHTVRRASMVTTRPVTTSSAPAASPAIGVPPAGVSRAKPLAQELRLEDLLVRHVPLEEPALAHDLVQARPAFLRHRAGALP